MPLNSKEYEQRAVITDALVDDRQAVTRAYCRFSMLQFAEGSASPFRNGSTISCAQIVTILNMEVCEYLNMSYWEQRQWNIPFVTKHKTPLGFLKAALWDMRKQFGTGFY